MTLATNTYEAQRLDDLSRTLRHAQEAIGGTDRVTAIWRLRVAREQITQTIKRLEAKQ